MVLMKEDNFKTILEVAELKICDALRDFLPLLQASDCNFT